MSQYGWASDEAADAMAVRCRRFILLHGRVKSLQREAESIAENQDRAAKRPPSIFTRAKRASSGT
jgi:hypothetical protein